MKAGILLLSVLAALPITRSHARESLAPGDLAPALLQADRLANGTSSNGNGILEPGETVVVEPAWRNATSTSITATGGASAFTGPGSAGLYAIADPVASYGTIGGGQVASCAATGDCYRFAVAAAPRPASHWDATFGEATSNGSLKTWTIHVGDTFTDVPLSSPFYRFVETLVHHGITGGCGADTYCPAAPVTREQLAVFALAAKEGRYFIPAGCALGGEAFSDAPATSPFCGWIEELARRGIVGGCGSGQYCPGAPVTREQMAVFVLATREGTGYAPPSCVPGSETFFDVPASSPFCRWIEELARRGVVAGCGGGQYCATAPVSRDQMAVFISGAFGLAAYGAAPHMYVVNTADGVNTGSCSPAHCSLPDAVAAANATPNPPGAREEIRFAIPGAGPHVSPPSFYPTITEAVVIDGYTQPGAMPNSLAAGSNAVLKIELNLASRLLEVAASNVLLRGLALNSSLVAAIQISSGSDNAIEGCFIGTDAAGSAARPNREGILVIPSLQARNRIGGTTPAQRNVISGNTLYGIEINASSRNLVQGNLIGTNRAGTAAIPNGIIGISAGGGSFSNGVPTNDNVIGGLEQGAGNLISGNDHGIFVSGYVGAGSTYVADNTRIQGNRLGVSADGSPLPNRVGIKLQGNGVRGTQVGGSTVPAGNLVVSVDSGVEFTRNSIGFPSSTSVRGNVIYGSQYGILGVPESGDVTANVIGPNGAAGVSLDSTAGLPARITIRGNSIRANGGLGIDLAPVGITPNDAGDADAGPNGLQNFPVVTSALRSGNVMNVSGTLESAPNASFTIELFGCNAAHPSGYGEGETPLGTFTVSTNAAGHATFAVAVPVVLNAGQVVTATATDSAGNTSEFSAARVVQ